MAIEALGAASTTLTRCIIDGISCGDVRDTAGQRNISPNFSSGRMQGSNGVHTLPGIRLRPWHNCAFDRRKS